MIQPPLPHRRHLFAAVTLLLLALAGGLASLATAQDDDGLPSFGGTVDVNLVLIDVYVTGRDGLPVYGLTAGDFRLLEEGDEVAIAQFEAPAAPAETAAAVTGGVAGGATEGARQPLQLVLYVDNANLQPHHRSKMLERVRGVLAERLQPQDQVMVVSFDRSLTIHQPFTADREAVFRALARIDDESARSLEAISSRSFAIDRIAATLGDDMSCSGVEGVLASYAEEVTAQVRATVAGLGDFIGSLAGIPGTKSLMLVSGGMELRPGADLYRSLDRICDVSSTTMVQSQVAGLGLKGSTFDNSDLMRKLSAAANLARVTFYPLEAAGAEVSYTTAANSDVAQERESSMEDSLTLLASETGGRALVDANDPGRLFDIVNNDAGARYVLGFYPAGAAGSGEAREVEVEVERPGTRVRHRRSFEDRPPEEQLKDRIIAAIYYGQADNPLDARLEPAGAPQTGEDGVVTLPVRVGVPIGQIALLPGADAHQGRLAIHVTTRRDDGVTAPLSSAKVPLTVPSDQIEQVADQLFGYNLSVTLTPGQHTLAVAVQDELAKTLSIVLQEVRIGAPGGGSGGSGGTGADTGE